MRRSFALGVEYDGSAYCGWQVQPGVRTVQAELERSVALFLGEKTPTICAGRTDTGVHALYQVASLETAVDRPLRSWVRALNARLTRTVAVRWVREVPEGFHARFNALSRTYEYWIWNHPVRSPLLHGRTGWVFRPLSVDRMREGAAFLLGEHDFTSFRAAECQAATPVRHVTRLEIGRKGDLVGIRIEANAFLQHMVRNIVGALVYVGTGRCDPAWIKEVLEARCRSVSAPTFDAAGLYFTAVHYAGGFLPEPPPGPFGRFPAEGN